MTPACEERLGVKFHRALACLYGLRILPGTITSEPNQRVGVTGEWVTAQCELGFGNGLLQTADNGLKIEERVPATRLHESWVELQRAEELSLSVCWIP